MKTFARIEDGVVRELLQAAELPEFHPSLDWRDVTNVAGIAEGWAVDVAGVYAAPQPPDISKMMRAQRDSLIASVAWRYERQARELRLGLPPTDDLAALDAYVQALADLPNRAGFPSSAAFDAYVKALADLPNQPGFPSITLPVAP